jgi:hypothetical protein
MSLFFCFKRPRHVLEYVAANSGLFCHVHAAILTKERQGYYAAYQNDVFSCRDIEPEQFDTSLFTWVHMTATQDQVQAVLDFFNSQIGAPYNIGAWLACPLNAPQIHSAPGTWFCSEICAEVTTRFLVDKDRLAEISARPPATTSPNRFYANLMALGFKSLSSQQLEMIVPSVVGNESTTTT